MSGVGRQPGWSDSGRIGVVVGDGARVRRERGRNHTGGRLARKRLRELIGEYRAGAEASGCPVEIAYRNEVASCVVRLPDEWRVRLQETMLDELREWLDADGVELVYG